MRKIAIIGAGSIVFSKTLLLDILATKSLQDLEICLMAPSTRRTPKVEHFAKRVIAANNLPTKISVTTDRKEALRGADVVITTFQIGGIEALESDLGIPLKYGVDQCIGDTLGPGGIFRGLRHIPVILELATDVEEICPHAYVLNYVNPMAMLCWALGKTGVNFVGLCHGVQITLDLISAYTGIPKEQISYIAAGINHMTWFLKLECGGRDIYPELRKNIERPEYYANEKVRGEVFRHTGYFMTESTGHLSEYLPYFRKNKKAFDLYCDEPEFGGETTYLLKWTKMVYEKIEKRDILEEVPPAPLQRSIEYGSHIIEAFVTGKPFQFQGNVINECMIQNLPDDCCTEIPMYADGTGLHKIFVGNLPPQCAALNLTNINVQRLVVEAAINGDPEQVVHACMLDPLTSAVLTLKEIRDMAGEMLESQKKWLPQFEGKKIRPTPTINIPKSVRRVEVPVDPALAIAHTLGKLSE
jgi:alpha-galactosidase